jgi:hypothetical protein
MANRTPGTSAAAIRRREKIRLAEDHRQRSHGGIQKLIAELAALDALVDQLPDDEQLGLRLRCATLAMELEHHRRWLEWLTRPAVPDAAADPAPPCAGVG